MINNQQEEIIDSLLILTENGSLNWEKTSLNNKYQLNLDGYSITIMFLENDGSLNASLERIKGQINFIDSKGVVFDSITCYNIMDREYSSIEDLYWVVRRNALRINDKYSDILKQLKESK